MFFICEGQPAVKNERQLRFRSGAAMLALGEAKRPAVAVSPPPTP